MCDIILLIHVVSKAVSSHWYPRVIKGCVCIGFTNSGDMSVCEDMHHHGVAVV